jgi:hypothetical protein
MAFALVAWAAEALKDLTGMTPEQYAASEAAHRCYDIVMPPRGGQSSVITPQDSILLNRCSGETWVLVKAPTGKQGNWAYRWFSVRSIPDALFLPASLPPGHRSRR